MVAKRVEAHAADWAELHASATPLLDLTTTFAAHFADPEKTAVFARLGLTERRPPATKEEINAAIEIVSTATVETCSYQQLMSHARTVVGYFKWAQQTFEDEQEVLRGAAGDDSYGESEDVDGDDDVAAEEEDPHGFGTMFVGVDTPAQAASPSPSFGGAALAAPDDGEGANAGGGVGSFGGGSASAMSPVAPADSAAPAGKRKIARGRRTRGRPK